MTVDAGATTVDAGATTADAPATAIDASAAPLPPPLLHWRFDEADGTIAADGSGNGFAGTYFGEPALPVPSVSVPPTVFQNLRSRSFPADGRPGVKLVSGRIALGLQSTDELTLSSWFQATTAVSDGGDVINLGDDCFIRVKPTEIELAMRRSTTLGMFYVVAEIVDSGAHLDGQWHHLAGVLSATGLRLYLDGDLRATVENQDPILFMGSGDVRVGQRQHAPYSSSFQGNIDDVRIYRRALDAQQIRDLARRTR